MAETLKRDIPVGASRVLPLVGLLGAILVMVGIWYWVPGMQLIEAPHRYLGLVTFVAGVGWAGYGKSQFDRVGTPVLPFTKTTALVVSGPFRFGRNPMYLAMIIGLISVGIMLGKIAPFAIIPLFIMWIRGRFIPYEEQAMEARFGEEYLEYKARVRRWI